MGIVRNHDGRLFVSSWSTGLVPIKEHTLVEEAEKNPEAVINRLMRQNRWEEAERIMDKFLISL